MAKTVTEVDEATGKVKRGKVARAKTTEIPWTAGPRNWRQRRARDLWG